MFKVFLVDDEIVVREGIRTKFPWEQTEFVRAGEAPDGEIALNMLQEVKPDILITDIRMPFMDGLELCRRIKADSGLWRDGARYVPASAVWRPRSRTPAAAAAVMWMR